MFSKLSYLFTLLSGLVHIAGAKATYVHRVLPEQT